MILEFVRLAPAVLLASVEPERRLDEVFVLCQDPASANAQPHLRPSGSTSGGTEGVEGEERTGQGQ